MAHEINGDAVVKLIEQCQVALPSGSLPSTTLPLTFFDIPWFLCHPVKRIFFYYFPHPIHYFLKTTLPILKHSLSLTLQHFFPFVSNVVVPPQTHLSYIRYFHGDSLSLTVAESTADFNLLISDSPQDVRNWHPLVPALPPTCTEEDGTRVIPLMEIQITVLRNNGLSICITFNHLASDGKSLHHFMKFWASVCKARGDMASLEGSLSFPSHERDKVKDSKGLKLLYIEELQIREAKNMEFRGLVEDVFANKVRFTLVLSREKVDKLKRWVTLKSANHDSLSLHISTFVVTCSLIWGCMIKSKVNRDNYHGRECDELCNLVILADCRDRPEFSLPSTYFGNCIVSCIVAIRRIELVGENGFIEGANAIERHVRDFEERSFEKE